MVNNLMTIYGNKNRTQLADKLNAAGIDPDARPEDLSVDKYVKLFQSL